MVKVKTTQGVFNYEKSTRKGKKLMVTTNGTVIHFGSDKMQHYKDRTGIWSNLDHNDDKRRKSYLARSKGILDGMGDTTYDNIMSPNYHSREVLW
jgi:hypothetical protein